MRAITPEINMHHHGLFETEVSRPMMPVHFISDQAELPEPPITPKSTRYHTKRLQPKLSPLKSGPKRAIPLDIDSIPKSCPNSARRPKTALTKKPFSSYGRAVSRQESRLPTTNEIRILRKQVKSNQPKIVQWGNSVDQIPYYNNLKLDVEHEDISSSNIIKDQQEIDISQPLQPVSLISNTASVMDYCGIPNSLTFIR